MGRGRSASPRSHPAPECTKGRPHGRPSFILQPSCAIQPFRTSFAHESLSPTIRLNTSFPGVESSGSLMK